MELGPYLWLGEIPGRPVILGDRVGRHTRGPLGARRVRPNIRIVRGSRFATLQGVEDLAIRLFGRLDDGEVHRHGDEPLAPS